jgi:3-oxoacyl-[acyl-carrier protein] reductase
MIKKSIAVGHYGTVEEIAGMVAYLAGTEAGYITSVNLNDRWRL